MEFTKKRGVGDGGEGEVSGQPAPSSQEGRRKKGVQKVRMASSAAAAVGEEGMAGVEDTSAGFVYGEDGAIEGMVAEDGEQLVFEDPFGDEFEEEEFADEEEEYDDDGNLISAPAAVSDKADEDKLVDEKKQTWRPNVDRIGEGEELDYDPSAYVMYHSLRTEWPCLSFDIMRDNLGDNRQRFPLTMYVAAGSQADRGDKNKVTLLKLSDLHKTQVYPDSDEESDNDDLDDDPVLEHVNINHQGGVNRIRCMPQSSGIIATMADTRHVNIFDASACYQSLMGASAVVREAAPTRPTYVFKGHSDEGFAIDWSSVVTGRLATGDCAGNIRITNSQSNGSSFTTDNFVYKGHTSSVEDIQWSPSEATVFISVSADKSIRIWDVRGKNGPQITIPNAHTEDVNVCSWNRGVSYLLATGSDDGSFKVWDLRSVASKREPLANFKYHTGPITSIQWAPHDESVLCVSSADNQVTVWDLSVEGDETAASASAAAGELQDFPPQLLFIHQGQTNVKEIHHHPQIPGVIMSTAEDGFNIFKPAIHAN